jgi:hypothetical protein
VEPRRPDTSPERSVEHHRSKSIRHVSSALRTSAGAGSSFQRRSIRSSSVFTSPETERRQLLGQLTHPAAKALRRVQTRLRLTKVIAMTRTPQVVDSSAFVSVTEPNCSLVPASNVVVAQQGSVSVYLREEPAEHAVPIIEASGLVELPPKLLEGPIRLGTIASIEVVTQFSSASTPPRVTGTRWSTVGESSQFASCVSLIFEFE